MSDIYKSPESELMDAVQEVQELASRWSRLFASLLDTIILMFPLFGIMYLLGMFDPGNIQEEWSVTESVFLSLVVIVSFFLINFRFLARDGQTLGKKMLGIRIVAQDGSPARLGGNIMPRYLVYFIPGQIPGLGQFFNIVNILFIFRKDKRCIHDLAGKTRVVRA